MSPRTIMWPVQVTLYHLRIWAKIIIIVMVLSPIIGTALGIAIVEGQRYLHSKEWREIKKEIGC